MGSKDIVGSFSDYRRSLQHFAIGNVFWMYTFDAPLDYPQTRYTDIMSEGNELYKSIAGALQFTARHHEMAFIPSEVQYGAIHWRRGDYREKCAEELYPLRCYPGFIQLTNMVSLIDPGKVYMWTVLSNRPTHRIRILLSRLGYRTFNSIKHRYKDMDTVDLAIVDQIVAVNAQIFIGNMYSSFTRTISDMRRLRNLTSTDFF
jgi:hypothetical protein